MGSVFSWLRQLGPGGLVLKAIVVSLVGIGLLLAFILGRRAYRRRYFRHRDARTFAIRKDWDAIVSGKVPIESWRFHPLDREIIEAILLDRLEAASADEASLLLGLLRSSGLLDTRIHEARALRGWRRRRALVALGRMRAPEVIPALTEALDDPDLETRVAALRGLARTGLLDAAVPILERLVAGSLRVPALPLQNALLNCCRSRPMLLVTYLSKATGDVREIIARVLGELATLEMEVDLLVLAADPMPEVRASAARALARAKPQPALAALTQLTRDPEWFVRLRAVAGLGMLETPRAIPVLLEGLCDANREVRRSAAAALARFQPQVEDILEHVVETQDAYALQAMISELDRSGQLPHLITALADPARGHRAATILLEALQTGTQQLQSARAAVRKPQEVAS